jgi:hypothetical protein
MEAVMGDGTQRSPLGKVKDSTAGYRQLVETLTGSVFEKRRLRHSFRNLPRPLRTECERLSQKLRKQTIRESLREGGVSPDNGSAVSVPKIVQL